MIDFLTRIKTPSQPRPKLTTEEFEVRVWGFVVVAITVILFGIVFALLYSVTFVTQPIKSMAPIDQAYAKMLNDIVLLIVGGILHSENDPKFLRKIGESRALTLILKRNSKPISKLE